MFDKAFKFFKEVKQELSKVSWPKRKELSTSTSVVIVVAIIFATVIWVLDTIFSRMFMLIFR